jgi:hypothetical protein
VRSAYLGTKNRKPTKLETKVEGIARRRAFKELMRVPWNRFHEAHLEYLRWEAFAFWVRAIVEAEGGVPSWLTGIIKERCPGFFKDDTQVSEPRQLIHRLDEWSHNHLLGYAKQEGWLDAVIFYAVRNPLSEGSWAHWEHCEKAWKGKHPIAYPEFEEWWRTAQNRKIYPNVIASSLAGIVDEHVDWQAFLFWLRPMMEGNKQLPPPVVAEVKRRCPGFMKLSGKHRSSPQGWSSLTKYIEERFFSSPKTNGWFTCVLKHARFHPRHARTLEYSRRWNKDWSRNPSPSYPSFSEWRKAADDYIELD